MTRSIARDAQRRRRVVTAVPLVLVSAAWTTHLAGTGPVSTGSATVVPAPQGDSGPTAGLPSWGASGVEAPASVSTRETVVAAGDRAFTTVVGRAPPGEIPSSALAAYQRAETVINAADPACGLTWQLIAAIGKVESDHGRFAGSVLDADGVAAPAIVGPVLDGRTTALIRDTDAGEFDGDAGFDRAVGPMQFIPSTWAVVGVDADNDGFRNPQDIDDAALGTAVYLCSADDDLTAVAGQQAAVYRYNHSDAYVALVLSIMDDYLAGDFAAGPDPMVSARYATPTPLTPIEGTEQGRDKLVGRGTRPDQDADQDGGKAGGKPRDVVSGTKGPDTTDDSEPTPEPEQTPDAEAPAEGGGVSQPVAPPSPTPPTTPPPPPPPPTPTVEVDPTLYLDRALTDVQPELEKLKLVVNAVEAPNEDPSLNGLVSDVTPDGSVKVGDPVTVTYYAEAVVEPAPEEPTTAPTAPADEPAPPTEAPADGGAARTEADSD